jgi:hypothetical protein
MPDTSYRLPASLGRSLAETDFERYTGLKQEIFTTETERGPRRATEKGFSASYGMMLMGPFRGASAGEERRFCARRSTWGGFAAALLCGPQWSSFFLCVEKRAIRAARREAFAPSRRYAAMAGFSVTGKMWGSLGDRPHRHEGGLVWA